MPRKYKVELVSITIHCEKLDTEVTLPSDKLYWYGYDDQCETCGSHGGVYCDIECECGKRHKLELNSW